MPHCLLGDNVKQEGRFLFKRRFSVEMGKARFANLERQSLVIWWLHVFVELRFNSELSLNLTFDETEAQKRRANATLLLVDFIAQQPHIFELILGIELEV